MLSISSSINNMNRKADKLGNVHFISFLGSILSRLAYKDDNTFLTSYTKIMGPVIQPKILKAIDGVRYDNIAQLKNDQEIFGLNKDSNDIFKDYEIEFNGKSYIDFVKLQMPQNVNVINGDIQGTQTFPIPGEPTLPNQVKYISIGWSNYGEIYVVADLRMPNTIFLIFRGTYSSKTASLYTKPTSLFALEVCKDSKGNPEKFLYGIFKASSEMIHTIIEAIRYLATDFLGATQPNSVKIFTTGHSLGGAMCTNFAYLWMNIKETPPYNAYPYNVLANNIICVSLGAPRCMGKIVAQKFCDFVRQNKILYLRITTRGDPVPLLPTKAIVSSGGFIHPCSDDPKMREIISEDCNATLTMRPLPRIEYEKNIDCQNYKTRTYIPNPLSHTVYLDIMYTKAVDIKKFFTSAILAKEVLRANGATICRLIMGQLENYKVIFFNVNNARKEATNVDEQLENELSQVNPSDNPLVTGDTSTSSTPPTNANVTTGGGWFFSTKTPDTATQAKPQQPSTNYMPSFKMPTSMPKVSMPTSMPKISMPKVSMPKFGGKVAEDVRMTKDSFNLLINQMVNLTGDLCPQKGAMADIQKTFNNQQIMPDLSCYGSKIGGKNAKRKTRRHNKSKKSKKSKRTRNVRRH